MALLLILMMGRSVDIAPLDEVSPTLLLEKGFHHRAGGYAGPKLRPVKPYFLKTCQTCANAVGNG